MQRGPSVLPAFPPGAEAETPKPNSYSIITVIICPEEPPQGSPPSSWGHLIKSPLRALPGHGAQETGCKEGNRSHLVLIYDTEHFIHTKASHNLLINN